MSDDATPSAEPPKTLFERMMTMSKRPEQWRVEQQVKSGLGTLTWLPTGATYPSRGQAEAAANQIENRTGLPTRVTEVAP